MRRPTRALFAVALLLPVAAFQERPVVDAAAVAKIREEGLQRSHVMDYETYIADVLGARLTNSRDMQRAQQWLKAELGRMGLANVAGEPYMDYGVTWDNEYVSLHMLEPDYSPMTAYPVAHTAGTDGKVVADAMIVDLVARPDLEKYRGRLKGKAVLVTPPAAIDLDRLTNGVPRLTDDDLRRLQEVVITPPRPAPPRAVPNPNVLTAAEKWDFYKAEGVAVVLQCESGWLGACRAYSRPTSKVDGWSRAGDLATPAVLAVNPEHYNRMYRILQRGVPVKVEAEVRNAIGTQVVKAENVVAEIPGTDKADEVVMLGAHFDSWHGSGNASDNASGVAVAMEAMRILKAIGARPRRTIRIALWSGEEQGLYGSRAYVKEHFGNPAGGAGKPAADKFSVYFNQDYNAGQYRGVYLQGNEAARAMLSAWMEPFRDFGMNMVSNQSLGSTDHVAFDEAGLPGIQFLQDHIPGGGGHSNLDPVDAIQPMDLMKNAVVMASYVYHAAMADQLVPRKGGR
ncbi:MAG: M20/M25/M40 family metallo-hydrolase [Gemmatimonadota bacterium]|nr:M20/M25/M40 family metallo-hydrolase [Gemmatimonadota bacterium]